jgi:hypothetical protein
MSEAEKRDGEIRKPEPPPAARQSVLKQGRPEQSILKPTRELKVDLVFCVDATRSMESCITALKTRITGVVRDELPKMLANAGNLKADFRYRLLLFRDCVEDEVRQIEDADFTADLEQFVKELGDARVGGGGDEPESMLDGIAWAFRAGDSSPARKFREDARRVLIVFTDAPTRETLAEGTLDRLGLKALGLTGTVNDVMAMVLAENALVFVAAPEKGKESGVENKAMRDLAAQKNVIWNATSELGLADVDMSEFLGRVFSSVTQAAAKTVVAK